MISLFLQNMLLRSKKMSRVNLCDIPHETSHLLQTVYKNLNHRVNRIKFELSRDDETNPGPADGSKSINFVSFCSDISPQDHH